ncbi:hypothetical protein R3P38DRAFT_3273369 [Favolaschia claudopus]|uniref:Uncharacterized protein n=1 Tax=Favolaschia claudopus TaxID=2862362 RepID=A0AAW0B3E0_9AGAR
MLFSASIAVVSVLSLSAFTAHSAPLAPRRVIPQFCTGTNGGGICEPINIGSCTETPDVQSLILNADADCVAFHFPNCKGSSGEAPFELFSDDSQSIGGRRVKSVSCDEFEGTVNGFTKGSAADIEQEAADRANGIEIPE